MSNEQSSGEPSVNERLQELKDNATPSGKADVSQYREHNAKHGPRRFLDTLARKALTANQAGVPELLNARKKISKQKARAQGDHREAKNSLAEQSAANADANDPQAMMARQRLEQIRADLSRPR